MFAKEDVFKGGLIWAAHQRTGDKDLEPQRHKGHKENSMENAGRVSEDGGWTQATWHLQKPEAGGRNLKVYLEIG